MIKYKVDGYILQKATITESSEEEIDIIIPDNVKVIAENAFSEIVDKCFIKNIVFPDTLLSIGDYAFSGIIEDIHQMKLPHNLEFIGDYAFSSGNRRPQDYGMTKLVIPDSVKVMGKGAFSGWGCLKSVFLGKGLNCVGPEAFKDCNQVEKWDGPQFVGNLLISGNRLVAVFGPSEKIVIPEGIEGIYTFAFSSSYVYKDRKDAWTAPVVYGPLEVILPSSMKSIGSYAFWGTRLRSLHIPEQVTSIGNNPIVGTPCQKLSGKYSVHGSMLIDEDKLIAVVQSNVNPSLPSNISIIGEYAFYSNCIRDLSLPSAVKEIKKMAFYGCKELRSIILPDSIKAIGDNAFDRCQELESITLPDSLETIGDNAFANCYKLSSLIIPASVKKIAAGLFNDLNNCRVIQFLGVDPPKIDNSSGLDNMSYKNKVFRVPAISIDKYRMLFPEVSKPSPIYPQGRILALKK